jgi:hypothetical protein
MGNDNIMYGLINFFVVAVIFLVVLAALFNIFCKKFKFNPKNIELYGLFLNLDTMSLIAIASSTINYLFLVWCMISFNGLNIIYIAFIFILILINNVVLDEFKRLPLSMVMGVIDCLAIQIIYLIYNYLINESFSYMLLFILGLVIIFVFLYYTYNLFRNINNIVVNHKCLKDKKYKI